MTMHFSCLITGENPEGQMAPFDANLEVPPSKTYLEDDEITAIAEGFKINPGDRAAIAAKLPDWSGHEGGSDAQGIYALSTRNPQAQWDWWQIGGRFRGFFAAKPGRTGVLGEMGALEAVARRAGDAREDPSGFDEIRKGDVDTDAMEAQAEARARQTWAALTVFIAGTPRHTPYAAFQRRVYSGQMTEDQARDLYQGQPRVRAFQASSLGGRFDALDGFPATEAAYVRRERLGAFCPTALLHEGRWYERGPMGQGALLEQKCDARWAREFRRIWNTLPDQTALTLADYHI